jgi:hypothetical protein
MLINVLLLTLLVGRCGQVFRTLLKSEVNAVRRFTIHSQTDLLDESKKCNCRQTAKSSSSSSFLLRKDERAEVDLLMMMMMTFGLEGRKEEDGGWSADE